MTKDKRNDRSALIQMRDVHPHEMRFGAEISDEILFTEGGRIVERGSPAVLFGERSNPRVHSFINGLGGMPRDQAAHA